MKKSLFVLTLAVFIFTGSLFAEPPKPGKTGTVTEVNAEKGSISIERKGDKRAFTFECEKEILKGIEIGDKVDFWYTREGKKRIATKVLKTEK